MSETISDQTLKSYFTQKIPAYVIHPEGLKGLDREEEFFRLMHGNLNQIARNFDQSAFCLSGQITLADGVDIDVAKHIAKNFSHALAKIEANYIPLMTGEAVNSPSIADTIDAFAGFHHILSPESDCGKYARGLIEKSFEILELGPIPPMRFSKDIPESKAVTHAKTH